MDSPVLLAVKFWARQILYASTYSKEKMDLLPQQVIENILSSFADKVVLQMKEENKSEFTSEEIMSLKELAAERNSISLNSEWPEWVRFSNAETLENMIDPFSQSESKKPAFINMAHECDDHQSTVSSFSSERNLFRNQHSLSTIYVRFFKAISLSTRLKEL